MDRKKGRIPLTIEHMLRIKKYKDRPLLDTLKVAYEMSGTMGKECMGYLNSIAPDSPVSSNQALMLESITVASLYRLMHGVLKEDSNHIYSMSDVFLSNLIKMEPGFPSLMLKGDYCYSIEFNKAFKLKDGTYHTGGVVIGTENLFTVSSPDLDKDLNPLEATSSSWIGLNDDSMDKIFEREDMHKEQGGFGFEEILKYFVLCAFYIRSKNANVERVIYDPPKTKKPKKIRQWHKDNHPLAYQTVGYGFHGRMLTEKGGTRSGHLKRVRKGPGRQEIEIQWINEYGWGDQKGK